MPYKRLLVRLHCRERQALEELYEATAYHLYACLYHEVRDEKQCEYLLQMIYQHVWTYPKTYCTEALLDQLLTHGHQLIQEKTGVYDGLDARSRNQRCQQRGHGRSSL